MKRDFGIFLFFIGMIFFNWPLISILKQSLAIYLFIVWLIFIGLIALATRLPEREDGGG